MKKLYTDPEFELIDLVLLVDVLGPSTSEGEIPIEGEEEDPDFDGDWL